MKAWEYILARGISKIFENMQKDEEKQEREFLKNQERRLDKGNYIYKPYEECFDLVPPKRNPHYVTEQEDGDVTTVIISKKPLSLASMQFDYPWDAEDYCELFYAYGLDNNANVIFKRDAPMLIADDDIACPYCKSSRPPVNWIKNSFEQELQEVPAAVLDYHRFSEDQFNLSDYRLNSYWCPICRRQVKADFLMKKGEEWKLQYLKDMKIPDKNSPLRAKNIREREEREQAEKKEGPRGLQARISNPARHLLQFNSSLIMTESHQGLMVKTLIKVDTKDQEIQKAKWIRVSCGIPEGSTVDTQATSYFHKDDKQSYRERRYRQLFPLRYYPIHEIVIDKYDIFYKRNANKIAELTKSYHKGEPLPIAEIRYDGEAMSDLDVIAFATDMGFSHIPAIIWGSRKKEAEDKYKDEVTIFEK